MADRISQSAQEAKGRLNNVLVHDRTDLSVQAFKSLQDDLFAVLSSYVAVDPAALKLELQVDGRGQRLVAVLSLPPAQRRRSLLVD